MHHQPPTLQLVPAPRGSPQAGLGAGGAEGGQPACTPFTLLGTGQPHSAPTGSCAGPGRASGFFNAWRGGTGGDLAWLLLREEAGCGQTSWWPLAVPSPLTRTLYCSRGQVSPVVAPLQHPGLGVGAGMDGMRSTLPSVSPGAMGTQPDPVHHQVESWRECAGTPCSPGFGGPCSPQAQQQPDGS